MAKPNDAGQTRRVIVALLADGAVHDSRGDIEECVAAVFGFSAAQRRERSAKQQKNTTPELLNHIDRVTGQLTSSSGYIRKVRNRMFQITATGRQWLAEEPHRELDERVEEWRRERSRPSRTVTSPIPTKAAEGVAPAPRGAGSRREAPGSTASGRERTAEDVSKPASPAEKVVARREFDPALVPTDATLRADGLVDPALMLAAREKANRRHHGILVTLDAWLRLNGWRGLFEQAGGIDLGATSPDRKHGVIFEAKTITAENELQQTRRAIGQLLEYRHVYGRKADRLCLVTDIALSRQRAQLLDELEIAVLLAPVGATSVTAQNPRAQRMLPSCR